jgi:ribosomal protein S18 acetylase RimI-like enzyme
MTASPSDNAGTLRPSVRVMTLDDVKEVAESLAAAFDDDPVWEFLVPAPSTRKARMATIFRTMIRLQHLPHSTSYTDLERLSGALWDPPGHWRMTPSQQMRGTPGFIRGFGANLVTSLRTLSAIERAHPKGPHYYLAILGTRPEQQGKGIGSELLQPVLRKCDTDGTGAYLESSKESNIAFYSRHGFTVTGEIRLPKGPKVWPMWRYPRPPEPNPQTSP